MKAQRMFLCFFFCISGCGAPPQVDYSRYRGQEPELELEFPEIRLMESGGDVNKFTFQSPVKTESLILFKGGFTPDPVKKSNGFPLSIRIFQMKGGKPIVIDSTGYVVSFSDEAKGSFSKKLKGPKLPGTYFVATVVNNHEQHRATLTVVKR